jgi:hypothetical protein
MSKFNFEFASLGDTYSAPVGGIYIFNLIVGVGALALPSGFYQAGLVLATHSIPMRKVDLLRFRF